MHSSLGFLTSVIEQIRFYTENHTVDAKYSNGFLAQNVVLPVVADILARLNLNADNPVLICHTLSLQADQQYYQLPPTIQEVWRLCLRDDSGHVLWEVKPRGVFNPRGKGWALEGNTLSIEPYPSAAGSVDIEYVPTCDVLLHTGTGYLQGDEFVLGASPTLGLIDRRHNAYSGCTLRLIPSTGAIQERLIRGYDANTRTCHLRLPFNPEYPIDSSGSLSSWVGSSTSSGAFTTSAISSSGDYAQTIAYEIAPPYASSLWEAIALGCSVKLGIAQNMRQEKIGMLEREYKKAMKTITDNLANMQMRTGKAYDRDTVDHPTNRGIWGR